MPSNIVNFVIWIISFLCCIGRYGYTIDYYEILSFKKAIPNPHPILSHIIPANFPKTYLPPSTSNQGKTNNKHNPETNIVFSHPPGAIELPGSLLLALSSRTINRLRFLALFFSSLIIETSFTFILLLACTSSISIVHLSFRSGCPALAASLLLSSLLLVDCLCGEGWLNHIIRDTLEGLWPLTTAYFQRCPVLLRTITGISCSPLNELYNKQFVISDHMHSTKKRQDDLRGMSIIFIAMQLYSPLHCFYIIHTLS